MHTGSKYHRTIHPLRKDAFGSNPIVVDVYRVIDAFEIKDPGCQHAFKKIACRGIRGKGGELQDTMEAIDALIESARMLQAKDENDEHGSLRLEMLDRAEAMFSAVSLGDWKLAAQIANEAKAAA